MKKIICIGSATKDIFVQLKETRIIDNPEDLTAKKLMAFEFGAKEYAKSFKEEVGGSAVNVSAGLAKNGIKPFVFARTSKGESGKWIIKKISKLNIKKNYMQQRGNEESEISVIISDNKNKDHIILRTGDSVNWFDLDKAIGKFRERVDWVFVASQKKHTREKFQKIVDFAKEKKAELALNPSSYQINNEIEDLTSFLKYFKIIFINRDEAIEILKNTGVEIEDKPEFLLKKIKELGVENVIITDGAKGAYAYNGEEMISLGIEAKEVIDTVGAGDSFASGFLSAYMESGDIKKGLAWGMMNSGSVVAVPGATNGLLHKKQLKKGEADVLDKIKSLK
ncbi:MAG: carbohydrate kinase family protein [Candidatus Moraniibacteriota bacterium]